MRPLSDPSPDPKDPRPLTPADFLMTGDRFLELLPTTGDAELVAHSRHLREAMAQLWQAYYTEYVTMLNKYVMTSKCRPYEYAVGECVHLLKEGKLRETREKTMAGPMRSISGRYKTGIIKQIHPGTDNISRQFVVDTGKTLKTLSYMTIAPLFI